MALPNLAGKDQTFADFSRLVSFFTLGGHSRRDTDVESFYGGGATPSNESLGDFRQRPDSQASTPTFDYVNGSVGYEIYPAWVNARTQPISKE